MVTQRTTFETLSVEESDRILTLTLNRPERLNAINPQMHFELEDFFDSLNYYGDINAMIITGAGRAFCAGGDISGGDGEGIGGRPVGDPSRPLFPAFGRRPRRLIRNLLEVEIPIVAAINGDAVGLGATIALLSDVAVAADHARIGDPHVRIGLVAGDGAAIIWPLLVGVNRAKEYLMTGELIPINEAERLGLVNHVVPGPEVMETARKIAETLANNPPWAVRWTKATVNKLAREVMNLTLDTSLAFEALSASTDDAREAGRAFVEKRPPRFTGT